MDSVLAPIEDNDVDVVDGENANANNHEYEDDFIEGNEDGEEHYEWNIDGVLISWLTLFFYDFTEYFAKN